MARRVRIRVLFIKIYLFMFPSMNTLHFLAVLDSQVISDTLKFGV